MTGEVNVEDLSDEWLAAALAIQVEADSWAREAGIALLVAHGSWLRRPELRCEVEAWRDEHGVLRAWIDWKHVDFAAPASSSESAILDIVGSLFGRPSNRPLSWLLSSLDVYNSALVADAARYACCGAGRGAQA